MFEFPVLIKVPSLVLYHRLILLWKLGSSPIYRTRIVRFSIETIDEETSCVSLAIGNVTHPLTCHKDIKIGKIKERYVQKKTKYDEQYDYLYTMSRCYRVKLYHHKSL